MWGMNSNTSTSTKKRVVLLHSQQREPEFTNELGAIDRIHSVVKVLVGMMARGQLDIKCKSCVRE